MIHISTTGPQGPEYEEWHEKVTRDLAEHLEEWRREGKVTLKPARWKELKEIFLAKAFHHKCAYCEGKYCSGHHDHVEHYRPKSEVTEDRKKLDGHPGYWWLAYEWTNLLLCCAKCNSDHSYSDEHRNKVTHPGKKCEFRVKGQRLCSPPSEISCTTDMNCEEPLLLNPYFDESEEHISFDEHGFAVPLTERGKETITVCDLNRPELIEERLSEAERIEARISKCLRQIREQRSLHVLEKLFKAEEPFSAFLNKCCEIFSQAILQAHQRHPKSFAGGSQETNRT